MKGYIYCLYLDDKICYVGSAKDMKDRMRMYKNTHNNPKQEGHYKTKISKAMREHGFDRFTMGMMEEVEVEDNIAGKRELYSIEGSWQAMFENLGINLYNTVRAQGLGQGVDSEESYQRRLARQREKIPCDICGKMICRMGIGRHKKRKHKN